MDKLVQLSGTDLLFFADMSDSTRIQSKTHASLSIRKAPCSLDLLAQKKERQLELSFIILKEERGKTNTLKTVFLCHMGLL